jgi:DNA-binding NtrC family response regulator
MNEISTPDHTHFQSHAHVPHAHVHAHSHAHAAHGDKHDLLTTCSGMNEVNRQIHRVAKSKVNVLITGESGTGKEVVARAIHLASNRAEKPFVAVNCAAIPETLLESELFGHAKGSFTGASQVRKGLFQEADGGTIFLDEIGDMSLPLQAKLLRVLQDQKIRAVGENSEKQVNVRILAATHQDLIHAVKMGQFREDLYYRLHVVEIAMPPLRERKEDIPILANYFVQKYSERHGLQAKKISKTGLVFLAEQRWPGNIRQLENVIERAVVMGESPELEITDFGMDKVTGTQSTNEILMAHDDSSFRVTTEPEFPSLNEVGMMYISYILNKTSGKKEQAAKILKIDRTTLHRKIVEFGLPPPVQPPPVQH